MTISDPNSKHFVHNYTDINTVLRTLHTLGTANHYTTYTWDSQSLHYMHLGQPIVTLHALGTANHYTTCTWDSQSLHYMPLGQPIITYCIIDSF